VEISYFDNGNKWTIDENGLDLFCLFLGKGTVEEYQGI